jgi:hypothetical protein
MKDTLKMAHEAGLNVGHAGTTNTVWGSDENLEAFEALVRSDERKRFCDVLSQLHDSYSLASDPRAIRARRNT